MLFLGLGTGLGSAIIVVGTVAPMELAHLPYKRGRSYVDVETTIVTADAPDDPVWTSEVSFTPAATLGAVP